MADIDLTPCHADLPGRAWAKAYELIAYNASLPIFCAAATLISKLMTCGTTAQCSYYWVFLGQLFGWGIGDEQETNERRIASWGSFYTNVSHKLMRVRHKELRTLRPRHFNIFGDVGVPNDATRTSAILLYADSSNYFQKMQPFVDHFRCYTDAHGIRLLLDSNGSRVDHSVIYILNRSIDFEFYVSVWNGTSDTNVDDVQRLVVDLFSNGFAERAYKIVALERTLAFHYAPPTNFGRIWAMSEHLGALERGAILMFFDVDVTIHPKAWPQSLAEKLLQGAERPHDGAPHVFISDSWSGTECVNSGFVAVRNTKIGHMFLDLWKQKLWWASSNNMVALAETVLEIIGAEVEKSTHGRMQYKHECVVASMPVMDTTYLYGMYCDCWQVALDNLIGPYRMRRSRIVSFVDPEAAAVNYIPNNLFFEHKYNLSHMLLAPLGRQPFFTPFATHWAGMRPFDMQLYLHQELLASQNFSTQHNARCPEVAHPSNESVHGSSARLGHRARQARCCQELHKHSEPNKWPWTVPDNWWVRWAKYAGCSDWHFVEDEECEELVPDYVRCDECPR